MKTTLSTEALALFCLHIDRHGDIRIDDANREPDRELEAAGLVLLGRPFTGKPRYHLTRAGYEWKLELLACAKEAV